MTAIASVHLKRALVVIVKNGQGDTHPMRATGLRGDVVAWPGEGWTIISATIAFNADESYELAYTTRFEIPDRNVEAVEI